MESQAGKILIKGKAENIFAGEGPSLGLFWHG
jgi:hypothetical protein